MCGICVRGACGRVWAGGVHQPNVRSGDAVWRGDAQAVSSEGSAGLSTAAAAGHAAWREEAPRIGRWRLRVGCRRAEATAACDQRRREKAREEEGSVL